LSVSPVHLRPLLTRRPERVLRTAPPSGGFAPIEDAWHLRDIEVDGRSPRIRRTLAEDSPFLTCIDGERPAAERRCLERALRAARDEFAQFREATLGVLVTLSEDAWSRHAVFQEQSISLRELVVAMAEHDESHLVAEFDEPITAEESYAPAPTALRSAAVGRAASH
jgi:hypothetical protein